MVFCGGSRYNDITVLRYYDLFENVSCGGNGQFGLYEANGLGDKKN